MPASLDRPAAMRRWAPLATLPVSTQSIEHKVRPRDRRQSSGGRTHRTADRPPIQGNALHPQRLGVAGAQGKGPTAELKGVCPRAHRADAPGAASSIRATGCGRGGRNSAGRSPRLRQRSRHGRALVVARVRRQPGFDGVKRAAQAFEPKLSPGRTNGP
jgi:hypothetical protein